MRVSQKQSKFMRRIEYMILSLNARAQKLGSRRTVHASLACGRRAACAASLREVCDAHAGQRQLLGRPGAYIFVAGRWGWIEPNWAGGPAWVQIYCIHHHLANSPGEFVVSGHAMFFMPSYPTRDQRFAVRIINCDFVSNSINIIKHSYIACFQYKKK